MKKNYKCTKPAFPPPAKRHGTFRRRADGGVKVGPPSDSAHERLSKSLETMFSIANCRYCGDKLQFKTVANDLIYVRRSC